MSLLLVEQFFFNKTRTRAEASLNLELKHRGRKKANTKAVCILLYVNAALPVSQTNQAI